MTGRPTCKFCGNQIVPARGPINAEILLVGEFPGYNELVAGAPFVGPAGEILKVELSRVGIQYGACRVANLWLHAPDKDELDYHVGELIKEMAGRKYVLFMGSECAKLFDVDVSGSAGLKIKSPLIPTSVKVAMISPNPAIAMHEVMGELRLSLKKFSEVVK